jgi:hypothetical protein
MLDSRQRKYVFIFSTMSTLNGSYQMGTGDRLLDVESEGVKITVGQHTVPEVKNAWRIDSNSQCLHDVTVILAR